MRDLVVVTPFGSQNVCLKCYSTCKYTRVEEVYMEQDPESERKKCQYWETHMDQRECVVDVLRGLSQYSDLYVLIPRTMNTHITMKIRSPI